MTEQALWLLRAVEDADPWRPIYDCAYAYVVAAPSEEEARRTIVDADIGNSPGEEGDEAWLDSKNSTCEQIAPTSNYEKPTVVLQDFRAG